MDAILLCMKKRGINFFRKIKFPSTSVCRFYGKQNFLDLLHLRLKNFDNVLIMAHGYNNAILTTTHDPNHHYTPYITEDEAYAFKNDFVFAVSCLTANEFGKRCIDEGTIAYLGYQVEIGCLFSSYSSEYTNVPKRINTLVDTIIKHIFINSLSQAYEEFLKKPISVQVLKERFSLLLETRISSLPCMDANQIYEVYKVKISEGDRQKFVVEIVLRVLSYLDDILPKLICLGDSNYISSSCITYKKNEGIDSDTLSKDLESNRYFIAMSNIAYKEHLREMARNA